MEDTRFSELPDVRSMGVLLFDPQWAEQAHVSGCGELLHVLNGRVELELDDAHYVAGPGDLLLVPPGARHRDVFDLDTGLQVFLVFFDWAAAPEYFTRVSNDLLCGLPTARKADLALHVERMRRDQRGDSEADRLVARAHLFTLLMLILREAQGDTDTATAHGRRRRRALMLEARRYLDQHYARPITLDDIARALNVSAFHLSHVFSQESDFTLFGYLTTLRMDHARDLLATGRYSIAEVAAAVGYENSNYFSKVFRKHFGHAPSKGRGERG